MTPMMRFRCEQCGHRLAVPPRHLGRLVTCPECGSATHPLAEQILLHHRAKARPALPGPVTDAAKPARKAEKKQVVEARCCINCGEGIGKLQKLNLWDNRIVCFDCYQKLAAEAEEAGHVVRADSANRDGDAPAPLDSFYAAVLGRPLRGGLFGALTGLCVAGAALYGAMSLLKDVVGVVTGLAFGALALLGIYLLSRWLLSRWRGLRLRNAGASDPLTLESVGVAAKRIGLRGLPDQRA